jgi:hypothetical protein
MEFGELSGTHINPYFISWCNHLMAIIDAGFLH